MTKVLYVTAFKDIGRGYWSVYRRGAEEYTNAFQQLAQICPDFVCFSDDETAVAAISERNEAKNNESSKKHVATIYPYENHFGERYIERERSIMNCADYHEEIGRDRIMNPEHCCPEYNAVNHNKVHFLQQALERHPGYDFYIWIDFHYTRFGDVVFPTEQQLASLPTDKITIFTGHTNVHECKNYTRAQIARLGQPVQGSLYFVPRALVETLRYEYEGVLLEMYHTGFTDDDQSIHVALWQRKPDMYNIIYRQKWGSGLAWARGE